MSAALAARAHLDAVVEDPRHTEAVEEVQVVLDDRGELVDADRRAALLVRMMEREALAGRDLARDLHVAVVGRRRTRTRTASPRTPRSSASISRESYPPDSAVLMRSPNAPLSIAK